MATEELINYIKQSLANGKTKDEISFTLSGSGWQEKDIEEAFASASSQGFTGQNVLQDIYPDPERSGEVGTVYGPQNGLVGSADVTSSSGQGEYRDIPPLGDQIRSAWGSFRRGFLPALVVMAAVTILSTIPSIVMLSSPKAGAIIFLIMILPIVVVSIWAQLVIYNIVVNENESGWSQFGKAFSKILPFSWIGILVGLIALGGFFLFIVPAIIFSIWFSLSQFVLLKEDIRGFKALFKSKEYVRGNFWAVLARVLILVGMGAVVGFPVGFISGLSGVAGPYAEMVVSTVLNIPLSAGLSLLAVAYTYEIYKGLRGKKGDVECQATTGKKFGFGAIAVWGFIAPILFIILITGIIAAIFIQGNFSQMDSVNTGQMSSSGASSGKAMANDSKREADLARIRVALESCYADGPTGAYPADLNDKCVERVFENGVPKDPKTGEAYRYTPKGAPPQGYELSAQMETKKNKQTLIGNVDESGWLIIKSKQGERADY